MSKGEKDWIEENLEFIGKNWETVENPDDADLRLTTEQIAKKIFEYGPDVPKGTIEMLQSKLMDLGFNRGVVTWPVIPDDLVYSNKDNCWAVCWLLKQKHKLGD